MGTITFTQLGRPGRTLTLSGNAAPHGRPRQGPVASPEQKLRESEVYLPGSDEPVIHIFGQRREPITFKGRFRDKKSGGGFAQDKHEEVKSFVSDQQACRVTWEDILDFHGLIVRYKPDLESQFEIPYELEIKVLKDLLDAAPTPVTEVKGPADITNQILASLKLKDRLPFEPPTLKGSVVDLLNGMVGDVNSATALLVQASDDIDSFATGTFTALRRFRAGLGQARVAVTNLRNTYDSLVITAAIENEESADESQRFWDLQSAWASSSLEALRQMAIADRESAKSERGNLLALHEAGEGETWQSIAERWYGTADRADDIRRANGADVGSEPVPGTVYLVPR